MLINESSSSCWSRWPSSGGGGLLLGVFEKKAPTGATTGTHAEPAHESAAPDAAHKAPASAHTEPAPAGDHGTRTASAPAAGTGHATPVASDTPAASHGAETGADAHGPAAAPPGPAGVAFTNAVIGPLNYELRERFWGWRPNDIVNVTDNVNNFQLGVLEVTRRATVELAERISRTGSTAAFDPHLERAMNYLMVKAEEYWFPSAETKFTDAMDELALYEKKLRRGEASFFTRADNLIPLLAAFEDLLGSCDENLVKAQEDDGEPVSHFSSDDYFYYAQGVASTMLPIMEAVLVDFRSTLENRHGIDVIHHAIHSLHIATEIHPWYVTEADLDGILANHRANMAAPISHARFYVSVLIHTLGT